jgi:subtilisin family serine protease
LTLGLPVLLTTVAIAPATAVPLQGAPTAGVVQKNLDPNSYRDGRYIVVLAEKPAATYDGGTPGLPATKPEPGKKLDADKAEVRKYEEHLEKKQSEVAGQQNVEMQRQFTAAVNGFSATLTADQAIKLAKDPGVLVVAPDTENAPDYSSTDFLKLSGSGGTWDTKFGGPDAAGKGVVVGVIDTGYTPSNPFFAGEQVQPLVGDPVVGVPYLKDGNIAMLKSDGDTFLGECQKGEGFDGSACNSKVLSAHYFADDFLKYVPAQGRAKHEVLSPVDVDSHGTHTASTAAGNANVETFVDGRSFGLTSGVAPAAKLSIYKVCWEDTDPNSGGCYSSSAVAAVDQAIYDGVDVLNYSISGSTTTTTDPVSMAFLSAASAGIFVAVSAGNSGETASTVNHGAPWVTTVAASSFSQELQGTVEFSDGSKFRGASIMNRQVVNAGVVLSANAAATAGNANAALCGPGTLDPAKVAGKVVVCDRGVFDRVAKSAEVASKGGVGMVLVNISSSSLDTDKHIIPTVHVNPPATEAIKAKVTANPTLTVSLINKDTTGLALEAQPQIAGFSSRGPLLATGSDLLKPDVAAPGVAVLAGVSPIGTGGDNFGFLSGTSMASPHVAGFGALILAKNPKWSPAVVKSAMMTTASEVKLANGAKNPDVHATGAGQVDPARVLDPGLVYDADVDNYLAFIQGTGIELGMQGVGTTKPRDMNVPSFSLGNLTGKIEVTRTVTALTPGTYRAKVDLPGVKVSVNPSVLNFSAAGEKKTFKVSFENQNATLGKFAMGSLTWQGANKNVASPIAVRPQSVVAAKDVAFTSEGGTGSGAIKVVSGANGPIKMTLDGLSKADTTPIELVPGNTDASYFEKSVVVPAGSPLAKFSVFSSDPNADFDMYVETPDGPLTVATSSASESVSIPNPTPGEYVIYANLYASPNGQATKGSVDASVLVPNVGNATLTPNPLRLGNGNSGSVSLNWEGLLVGSYIGRITFEGASDPTFVSVLVTAAGTVVVPPTSEDQDSNDGPGDSGDDGKHDSKDKKDKKDKGKKVKNEKGKIQNPDRTPSPNNAI